MRPRQSARFFCIAVTIAAVAAGCSDNSVITEPTTNEPLAASPLASASTGIVVQVADIEQLYAAVNLAANAGATVLLSPGTYVLSAKNPSNVDRPNGGRLDLQENMALAGVDGDRAAVTIDASALPQASFAVSFGRTGVIRAGRGSNSVEWLTVAGNPLAAAAIETDLVSTTEASIRVAHVVAGDNARGVDIRNVTASMALSLIHI